LDGGRQISRQRWKQKASKQVQRDITSFFYLVDPSTGRPSGRPCTMRQTTLIPQTQFHPLFAGHDSLTLQSLLSDNQSSSKQHITTAKQSNSPKQSTHQTRNHKQACFNRTLNRQQTLSRAVSKKQHHHRSIYWIGFAPRLFGPEGRKKKPTTRASNPPTSPRVRPIKFRKQRPPDALRLYDDYHTVTSRNRTEVLVSRKQEGRKGNHNVETAVLVQLICKSAIARRKDCTVLFLFFTTTYLSNVTLPDTEIPPYIYVPARSRVGWRFSSFPGKRMHACMCFDRAFLFCLHVQAERIRKGSRFFRFSTASQPAFAELDPMWRRRGNET
jgi:hypothetical protein